MAKDNLFLGMARGKVGDVVFSRVNGQQVSRVRNRSPRNPQSGAQMIQRVILSTVGKIYSFTQDLTDHSFEGFDGSSLNQQRFMKVNVAKFRDALADVIAYPTWENIDEDDSGLSFSLAGDYLPTMNEYIISEGTLPTLPLIVDSDLAYPYTVYMPKLYLRGLSAAPQTPPTYAQMCQYLGIQPGDQLTFITFGMLRNGGVHTLSTFKYARVIMEPSDGDMSKPFLSALSNGSVNLPNERNEGDVKFTISLPAETTTCVMEFIQTVPATEYKVGHAVILSRKSGDKWLRSTQQICLGEFFNQFYGEPALMEAIQSLQSSTSGSALYLNQADQG